MLSTIVSSNNSGTYNCVVCSKKAVESQQTSCCGELVCSNCVCFDHKSKCMMCGSDNCKLYNDLFAQRQIKQTIMHCTEKDKGCEWVGKTYTFHELHKIKECEYIEVSCSQCEKIILACNYLKHSCSECPNRKVECEICYVLVPFSQLQNSSHVTVCDCVIVKCNNKKCGLKFPRWFMESHKRLCCDTVNTRNSKKIDLKNKIAAIEREFDAHTLYDSLIRQLYMSDTLFFEKSKKLCFYVT